MLVSTPDHDEWVEKYERPHTKVICCGESIVHVLGEYGIDYGASLHFENVLICYGTMIRRDDVCEFVNIMTERAIKK